MDPPRQSLRFKVKRGELRPENVPPRPNSPKKTRRKKTNVGWLPKIREETEHNIEAEATSSNANASNSNNEGSPEPPVVREPRPRPRPEPRPPSARALALQTRRREAEAQARIAENTRRREKYFKPGHILIIEGHAEAIGPDVYRLKDNEFYTTPTLCGYETIVDPKEQYDFVTSQPQIRIPTQHNTSFFNKKNNYFTQSYTQQRQMYGYFRKEYGAYKMYVPFTSASGSHSIYNTHIQPFSVFKIEKENFTIPTPHTFTLTYKTHTKTYDEYDDSSKFTLYSISISGVLQSHRSHSKTRELLQDPDLRATSRSIVEIFSIDGGLADHNTYLYILLPNTMVDKKVLPATRTINPLINYIRDAIVAVYKDSLLSLEDLYGPDVRIDDLLTKSIPMSVLYPKIHDALPDQSAPMLVINKLCRYHDANMTYPNSNNSMNTRSVNPRFLAATNRGFRMKRHGKILLRNTIRQINTRPRYRTFKRIEPHTQHEILKLFIQRKRITHEKYIRSPEATINILALSSGLTKKLWRTFLASLDKSEFAAP